MNPGSARPEDETMIVAGFINGCTVASLEINTTGPSIVDLFQDLEKGVEYPARDCMRVNVCDARLD